MFKVDEIYDEAKRVVGTCADETFFRWLGDAVTLISNKGEFEGWKGFLDICTTGGTCVTLPREVETVIAVNLNGRPTLAKDRMFTFHLNGPGDRKGACEWSWQDLGNTHPVYRDLSTPAKLVAYTSSAADNGVELLVHGYDSAGNRLRSQVAGVWRDGYPVPTIYGYALPDSTAPTVARIVAVSKAVSQYPIRLSTIDDSGPTGTLLAVYEPDERLPQYRRIQLSRSADWVRVAYRKINPTFGSRYDHVPLKSRIALLMAVRALKYYHEADLGNAHGFEADAVRLETEAQSAAEPVTFMPIQVVDLNSPNDRRDFDIR